MTEAIVRVRTLAFRQSLPTIRDHTQGTRVMFVRREPHLVNERLKAKGPGKSMI